MAGHGPPPKPDEERQRRNASVTTLAVLPGGQLDVPDPKATWPQSVKDAWERFWRSPQAVFITDGTMDSLLRLFSLRANAAELQAMLDEKGIFVEGSKGQDVLNPAQRALGSLLPEIRQLESLFGLNPDAAARLGIKITKVKEGLAAYNQRMRAEAEGEAETEGEAEAAKKERRNELRRKAAARRRQKKKDEAEAGA